MLLLFATALAWDTIGAVWADEAFPLPYEVGDDFGGLDDAEALAAVQAAFATWEAVDCAGVSFTYAGRTSDPEFSVADGRNLVLFYPSGWPGDASLVSAPGITAEGPEIIDVDLALNGEHYAWATEGADGRLTMDLQAAVTHEIGHLLGLWHSSVASATLNPVNSGNPIAKDLDPDDIDGLCALYPAVSTGTGAQGDPCIETEDCLEGHACLNDGDTRYCAQACTTDAACPDATVCLEAGDVSYCAIAATGCGCATGGAGPPWGVVLLAAGLVRRRRQPA